MGHMAKKKVFVSFDFDNDKVLKDFLVPLTNVCKESKSSQRLNCVESATCESQQ